MGDVMYLENIDNELLNNEEKALLKNSEELLADIQTSSEKREIMSVPIAELATLGMGVSSLVPALQTITQTTTIPAGGLYRLANAVKG